jgi:sugar porter (SP) family MFS transporter
LGFEDIGVMSGAALYIKKDLKITDVQLEILMGILNFYSLVGSFAAGRTSDWIGRRFTVVVAAAFFFSGALLMGLAGDYATLMLGRFVAGVGVGYGLMIAPVYTAEVSPASARGFLTSFSEVFINIGILLGYVSNYAFARLPLHLGWRVMLGIGAAPSVLLALMVSGMPESPRWLVMKGRLADARAVLDRIAETPGEAAERLADIKAAAGIPDDVDGNVVPVPKRRSGEEKQVWKELILSPTPTVRRILLATLGLQFFQQASGVDSVVLYSPRVFQSVGISDDDQLLATTCAVGVTKTVIVLLAAILLDRVGRRPLMLTSSGGMVASLVGLATGLTVVGRHPDAKVPWAVGLCVTSTLAFVSFFSVGLGPMTAVYTSEIFPLRVRALGFAVGAASNRVTSGVISMTFLSLSKAITIGGSFFLYAGIAGLAWVFFFNYLPETRGRTLEEMGRLFGMEDSDMAEEESAAAKHKVVEMHTN